MLRIHVRQVMRTVHLPIYSLSLIEEELWDTEEYSENTDREDREEQDLLEILDLKLFGDKILVLILIDPFPATGVLLDSCLV